MVQTFRTQSKFNRDGSKSLLGSGTDLVVNNLFERTTLV